MEGSISMAARVRRQLKAGRPRDTSPIKGLNSFKAMGILVSQAERAGELMEKAGLDPADLRLGLIIRTGEILSCMWLPSPDAAQKFFEEVVSLAGAEFLGILWKQADREIEENGLPLVSYWITPFVADAKAQAQMELLRAYALTGGNGMHLN
jgi:hypothetical protein